MANGQVIRRLEAVTEKQETPATDQTLAFLTRLLQLATGCRAMLREKHFSFPAVSPHLMHDFYPLLTGCVLDSLVREDDEPLPGVLTASPIPSPCSSHMHSKQGFKRPASWLFWPEDASACYMTMGGRWRRTMFAGTCCGTLVKLRLWLHFRMHIPDSLLLFLRMSHAPVWEHPAPTSPTLDPCHVHLVLCTEAQISASTMPLQSRCDWVVCSEPVDSEELYRYSELASGIFHQAMVVNWHHADSRAAQALSLGSCLGG